jgi:NAD(P)-dependent dehydrogenase (short-subunit alcohol dehydrogenase family)
MNRLDRKVVIVTGAKGGLGSFVTAGFLAAGAQVVGVSRSIQEADFPSPHFAAMAVDLSSGEAARKVAGDVVTRFARIDALVHVMGGFAGGQSVADTDDDTIERMLDLNYRAAFFITRAIIPQMRSQSGGRILAVASRQGVEPAANTAAYSASKAALVALVRAIALENKDRGISANSVLPATMDTPGNRGGNPDAGGGQWIDPAQVAELLVYLASDAGAQITGAAIPVYGKQV